MNIKTNKMILPTYKRSANFMTSVQSLYHKGGLYQKAAEKVQAIIGRISDPEIRMDPLHGFNPTHHGEKRIKKCIKYDLGFSGCRLITIQDQRVISLQFAGSHDDCDNWLNKNRGQTLIGSEG
ncbi:uncharacterized protein METZ01_LOCUS499068, partial [marine metagenome]